MKYILQSSLIKILMYPSRCIDIQECDFACRFSLVTEDPQSHPSISAEERKYIVDALMPAFLKGKVSRSEG